MFHTCDQKFDVTVNLEKFWKLNHASLPTVRGYFLFFVILRSYLVSKIFKLFSHINLLTYIYI